MLVYIGASWLIYWFLIEVFSVAALTAALVTAVGFIVAGVLLGERPLNTRS